MGGEKDSDHTESDFDLDVTEQELLDEFGLLVAAEYYYRTSGNIAAVMDTAATPMTGHPTGSNFSDDLSVKSALRSRLAEAISRQKTLLGD